jgi:CYTH domain-containing protein
MEKESNTATPSGTPTGLAKESHHVQFQGLIFEVQVFSDQQVPIVSQSRYQFLSMK